jgi:hypothetical protein
MEALRSSQERVEKYSGWLATYHLFLSAGDAAGCIEVRVEWVWSGG